MLTLKSEVFSTSPSGSSRVESQGKDLTREIRVRTRQDSFGFEFKHCGSSRVESQDKDST